MDDEQEQFLRDELFSLTLMAVAQRKRLYDTDATEAQKKLFRNALKAKLEELAEGYHGGVDEHAHIENIEQLSNDLSEDHSETLHGGRFRIGRAQKALNLYLKYLWCLNLVHEPPHCPFDRNIIRLLHNYAGPAWTDLDSVAGYQALVEAAEAEAGDEHLAVWELNAYNDID